ncbi:hypothetical protein [uncultured Methanobrevibacter sp.]|uniref:hypothetical protein n=1 Tax=uncultured Methanobrevibacter sp. TaxID=253161 RepID=UPI0025FC71A6|nr:hypothetical protein [uncultured Methanobrevibacter sp.]
MTIVCSIVEDSSNVTISPTRHWFAEIHAVCSSLTYLFSPSSRRHAITSIFSSWLNPVGWPRLCPIVPS